jgi:hypothetical protein
LAFLLSDFVVEVSFALGGGSSTFLSSCGALVGAFDEGFPLRI